MQDRWRLFIALGILIVSIFSIAYLHQSRIVPGLEKYAENTNSSAENLDGARQIAAKKVAKSKETNEVKSKLKSARQQIQTNAELAEASAESLHYTPHLILDAAAKLAEVIELEAIHPELKNEFESFYASCAHDSSIITVTRAQCLKRFVDLAQPSSLAVEQFLSELPVSVVRLYQSL